MSNVSQKGAVMAPKSSMLYAFVFFSGFASLATEIIGPRLVASLFGSTTVIWATIISVTLLGISLGYFFAGRVPYKRATQILPVILLVNAFWLLGIGWLIWRFPEGWLSWGYPSILAITSLAFVAPAMLFSTASPLSITLLSRDHKPEWISRVVGAILAASALGSILGALVAAYVLIPWVGLTSSLRLFSLGCVLFAAYFLSQRLRAVAAFALVACLLIPQPSFHWESASGWTLLEQREGYYQTIRVYTDDLTFVRMHLGPSYETELNLQTGEPNFKYARAMVELVKDPLGKKVLIVGGAGHTQALALEARGAQVTEVEIDPFVVRLSDTYFRPIAGEVVIQDGRAYIDQAAAEQFDYVFIDAFSGPDSVPPQLTTVEFFGSVRRVLKPGGSMIYNFIGVPSGQRSDSFLAIAASMTAVFEDTRTSTMSGDFVQNIIFVASMEQMTGLGADFLEAPVDGPLLTDDLNPIEIFLERARGGEIYYRR
ncbi:MAG: fused MFS/spermidine synthase [Anaerolineales bacterium]|nr:fused MFS/spermidine synthase [Anaerolineales bacterium]